MKRFVLLAYPERHGVQGSRDTEIAWVGQPSAACMTWRSVAADESTTLATSSSPRSNTPGAQNRQLPDPMHLVGSMVIRNPTALSPR